MYVSDYKRFDVINGLGLRHSLFVSGCTHHCKGCFNAATWNFNNGTEYSSELEDQIIADLNINYVKISGLSILGGEPFQNVASLLSLVERVKRECSPDISIWIWSGYTFEELIESEEQLSLLKYADVLIDGRFILGQRDLTLKFRGSRNQRVLNAKESLANGKATLYEEVRKEERNASV